MDIYNVYGIRPVSYKTSSPLTKVKVARWNTNQGYESLRGKGSTGLFSERKDFHNLTLVGGVTVSFLYFVRNFWKLSCLMFTNYISRLSAGERWLC